MQAGCKRCNAAGKTPAASSSKSCELISGDKTGIATVSSIVISEKNWSAFLRSLGKKEQGLQV